MKSQLKVSRAVTKLCQTHPFWGSLMLSIGHKQRDDIPTACTDGKNIWWSDQFIQQQSEAQTRGLMAHELCHIIFHHCQKHGEPYDSNLRLCNIAMDYVINATLAEDEFELPAEGIMPEPKFKGMTWRQVYQILDDVQKKYQQKNGQPTYDVQDNDDGTFSVTENGNDGSGNGKPMKDQHGNGSGAANNAELTEEEQEELGKSTDKMTNDPSLDDIIQNSNLSDEDKADIKRKVIQAAQAAKNKGIGKLPGDIEELIDEIRESKVDWREYLTETFQCRYPDDYTFKRPNRKVLSTHDIYMPSMEGVRPGNIAVHIDTSGSVDSCELVDFLAELNEISETYKPERIYIFYTDYDVNSVEIFEQGEEITELNVVGRGGTSFVPTFNYIEEHEIEVDQMLVFSDMEVWDSCFPSEAPDFPVLFLSTRDDYNVPFGDCIVIKN